ncbi:MAG TPA: hypothetical protein VEH86_07380 [Candidatus Acidoferrum sp.]|nr:hypothetical protein [Candidatus Acidoferrum sp.]
MKRTAEDHKRRRHILNVIMWFLVLTFPIWLIWISALSIEGTTHAPIEIYLILMIAAYYVVFAYVPYIGIPWLLVVMFLAALEIRKRWISRRIRNAEEKAAPAKNVKTASPKQK